MESQDFAQNGTAESDSTAFLYKSLRRLYVYAQIFGCASFSYTPETGVHVKAINTFSLVIFTVFFTTIAYSNIILELTIDVKGYQAILFYFGLRTMLCFTLLLLWALTCFLFLYKKQIAHLMEEIIALDGEVCKICVWKTIKNISYKQSISDERNGHDIGTHKLSSRIWTYFLRSFSLSLIGMCFILWIRELLRWRRVFDQSSVLFHFWRHFGHSFVSCLCYNDLLCDHPNQILFAKWLFSVMCSTTHDFFKKLLLHFQSIQISFHSITNNGFSTAKIIDWTTEIGI